MTKRSKYRNLEPLCHTVEETCTLLNIGKTTLYKLKKRGTIKACKLAGRTLFLRTEIDKVLASSNDNAAVIDGGDADSATCAVEQHSCTQKKS